MQSVGNFSLIAMAAIIDLQMSTPYVINFLIRFFFGLSIIIPFIIILLIISLKSSLCRISIDLPSFFLNVVLVRHLVVELHLFDWV